MSFSVDNFSLSFGVSPGCSPRQRPVFVGLNRNMTSQSSLDFLLQKYGDSIVKSARDLVDETPQLDSKIIS